MNLVRYGTITVLSKFRNSTRKRNLTDTSEKSGRAASKLSQRSSVLSDRDADCVRQRSHWEARDHLLKRLKDPQNDAYMNELRLEVTLRKLFKQPDGDDSDEFIGLDCSRGSGRARTWSSSVP